MLGTKQHLPIPCRTSGLTSSRLHAGSLVHFTPKRLAVCASSKDSKEQQTEQVAEQKKKDQLIIGVTAVGLTSIAVLGFTVGRDSVEDLIYTDAFSGAEFGPGDFVGGLLWALALYYTSPLQLLLLFLGDIDTERPSDRILRLLGTLSNLPVDAIDYVAPAPLRAVTAAICGAAGLAVAWIFNVGLGDATWSVSTGLGVCMAAAVYEVGRPSRLSVDEALVLEDQWKDFAVFARGRLQRAGRCHESEVYGAFRKQYAKYRRAEVMSDAVLRDMIRNYHPEAERTPNGYYKNLSLVAQVDAFTGEMVGSARIAPPTPPTATDLSDTAGSSSSSGDAR